MNLIKIGIEAYRKDLRQDLLSNPGRYFFISILDHRACLCIRTCDNRGENLQSHIVDGFMVDSTGYLASIFEEVLEEACMNAKSSVLYADCKQEVYPISSAIAEKISSLPGLIDWIISSILTKGRNIAIYPASWQS